MSQNTASRPTRPDRPAADAPTVAPSRVRGVGRAVAAERITVLATPAARILVVAAILMAIASLLANLASADDLESDDMVRMTMHASTVATLIFALVAGVYSATSDYRFSVVDQRALSEPRRGILLTAKAVVAAGLGMAYGLLGALTAATTAMVAYSARDATFELTSAPVWQALVGVVVGAPLFAVIGVAVGTLIPNQPFALGGALAWTLIVEPTALLGLPDVARWLPGAAGLALTNSPDEALASQTAGGAILTIYAVAFLTLAAARSHRMDL